MRTNRRHGAQEAIEFGDGPQLSDADRVGTERLAAALGLEVDDFVDVFGAGWVDMPSPGVDLDADPSGLGDVFGAWSVAGTPYQVAMRVQDDAIELGTPHGHWFGPGELRWQVRERRAVPRVTGYLDHAGLAVADVVRRRRASFRYCRYCRRLTPPEERFDAETCHACGVTWLGIVY